MRRLVVPLVVAAALAVPGVAAAKEISAMKVCGASGCATSTDKATLMQIAEQQGMPDAQPSPKAAPYYKLRFFVSEPGRGLVGGWDLWWVPSANRMWTLSESGTPMWATVADEQRAFLEKTAAGVTPYAKPRFSRVTVDLKPSQSPNSYLALFDPTWTPSSKLATDWKPIVIHADRPNPWTDHIQLFYSPKTKILWRGAERVRVPDRIGANIEARRSLAAATPSGSRAWAWAAGTAALAAGGAAFIARRRRST